MGYMDLPTNPLGAGKMQDTTKKHPNARCPFCGLTKPCVAWRVCSQFCDDYSQAEGLIYEGLEPISEFEMTQKRKAFIEGK